MTVPKKREIEETKEKVKEGVTSIIEELPSMDKVKSMIKDRPFAIQLIQTQILYDMASMNKKMMDKISRLEEQFSKTLPRGDLILREYTVVSTNPTRILAKEESTMPWISFDITNDGKSFLYVSLDKEKFTERCSLAMGESKTIDMKTPIIGEILLYSAGTSVVRIYATR